MTQPLDVQTETYMSHESQVAEWRAANRASAEVFSSLVDDKSAPVMDAACGDGCALERLRELGHTNLIGVEAAAAKTAVALQTNPNVKIYLHDLHNPLPQTGIHAIHSRHTLEHCHSPGVVLNEWLKALVPNGLLYLTVPFPDCDPDTAAHCGSEYLHTRGVEGLDGLREVLRGAGFLVISDSVAEGAHGTEARLVLRKPL